MSRLTTRIASSVLLAVPVVAHAGDAPQWSPSTGGPATHGTAAVSAADQEFLEYLGLWDGGDEDWVVAAEPVRRKARAPGVESGPASAPATSLGAGDIDQDGNGEQPATGKEQGK
jgi:hypothetical protein